MIAPNEPHSIINRAEEWLVSTALPLWANAGVDAAAGRFHERLHPDGSPDEQAPLRVRVQLRQIFVYALAMHLGWHKDASLPLRAFDWLVEKAYKPDGAPGFVHVLASDGSVQKAQRDTVDQVFALLACSWLARVSGDARIRMVIDEQLDFLDEHLTAEDGSLLEGMPPTQPRRQMPHMHAFEAMLALHEALGHAEALPRARQFHQLMETRFYDAQSGTITEFFDDSWQRTNDIILPGLQAEWSWMIRRYERLAELPYGLLASRLLDNAVRLSDPQTGLVYDEADRHFQLRAATQRSWPQTELAKAWIGEHDAGREQAAEHACHALSHLFEHYIDRPFVGGWSDQRLQNGTLAQGPVQASTLYHIIVAIAEACRTLR